MKDKNWMSEFDFDAYLEQSVEAMKSMEDKRVFQDLVKSVLEPAWKYLEERSNAVEEQVREELTEQKGAFDIYTGIVPRKNMDIVAPHMYPMREEDLQERHITMKRVMQDLEEKKEAFLFSVIFDLGYRQICELAESDRAFQVMLRTERDSYTGLVRVKQSDKYLKIVEKLYEAFVHNGIEWKTLCAPYLYKIFDVYLCEMECYEESEVIEATIDFGEYKEHVRYHDIPVWNVYREKEKTCIFPEPCIDQKRYRHVIYEHRLGQEKEYMLAEPEVLVWNCHRVKGDLEVIIDEKEARPLNFYIFDKEAERDTSIQLFHNKYCLDRIREEYRHKYQRNRTKGELREFVNSLGYGDYMELTEIEQVERYCKAETYSMDAFIENEFTLEHNTHTLLFHFEPKHLEWNLNQDILSYLTSRLQRLLPEFHCVGTFRSDAGQVN